MGLGSRECSESRIACCGRLKRHVACTAAAPEERMLKSLTTVGLRRSIRAVARELRLARRHRAGLRNARRFRSAKGLRLQLGSGGQPKAGWVNIDLLNPTADVALDLREDFPFEDGSVAFIYTEHLFEHLHYPVDAKHLLRECRRVLEPGGTLSIVVPNFGEALRAYVAGDETFFLGHDRVRSYLLEEQPTLMHHVNYWFRQDGLHRYAYDAETLTQVLRDTGFESVRERAYDHTLDSEHRYLLHSLYMESQKPLAGSRSGVSAEDAAAVA